MKTEIIQYNQKQTPEELALCECLMAELDKGLPEAESKMWHAHPVWFLNGNPIVGYGKQKVGIRLMFWSGASFEEAGLERTGKFKAAVIHYISAEQIEVKLLQRWLKKARLIQWDYKNIVKRKGMLERIC